uniref:Uncharacterized protein LOC111106843 isoform X2 n=1 Tax=Crassostrea virginica TaxID=6565 RepID=A0A8B8B264_CRAVI|nr:uncharacterized protein LOC111106843 isoform X2 [Crassostrea virginica]
MWYALVLYIIDQQQLTMVTGSTTNMGYRFEVQPVDICPGNKTAFETAADKINCTSTGRYLCAPNTDLTHLIEFCTDRPRSLFLQGNCVRLEGSGDLNHYDCSEFSSGCPNEPYFDDELYKYPACLTINKISHCFTSENDCTLRESNKETPESNRETRNYVILFTVIPLSIVITLILATGVILCLRKSQFRKVKKTLNNDQIDKNELRQFIKKGHLTICHARCIIVGCAGAGKTTFLKRMEGATLKDLKDVRETDPLDIHVVDFEVVREKFTIQRSNIDMTKTITFSKSDVENENKDVDWDKRTISDIEENQSEQNEETYPLFYLSDSVVIADNDSETNDLKDASKRVTFDKNTEKQDITDEYNVIGTDTSSSTSHEKDYKMQTSPADTSFLSEKRKNYRISFINFGGQHIYYAFHQIYLSANAVYILVLDMTKDFNEKEPSSPNNVLKQFESWTFKDYYTFWLKSIDSFSDVKTPVIVVGTHAENMSAQDRKTFFKKFFELFSERKDLLRHLHTERCFSIEIPKNEAKLDDLHEIKTCIASIVQSLPQWKEKIKPKWAMFEYLLKNGLKKKIVSRKELSKYNENFDEDFKLPENEITVLLKYLNRIGSILYNADDDNIRNFVILDVHWFVDTFKGIITHPVDINNPSDNARKHFHETGELEDHQLDALLTEKNDMPYLSYKNELISYMDHLGMLAICYAKTSVWYYFPSLNRKTFNKEQDTPKSFKPSTILCFQFDEEGQLPIFLFYALVSKCNKLEGWDILVEDKKKCIYEKTACFSYRDIIVIICICKFQIQVQVFFPPDYDSEKIGRILVEIQITMERNIRQFKRYTYEIGYKCQNGELLSEKDNSFIALEDFPTDRRLCSRCVVSKKHIVENSICWMQRSRPDYSDISDSDIAFKNSNENTDEGLVSLKRIFHDALTGKMENFKFHLEKEIGPRKYLLKILTENGWNIMHCAARGGNSKIFEIITREMNEYKMKNETTYDQMTVLHIAAKYGRYNICKRILEKDDFEFLNEISLEGKNACHFAAEGGFIDVLELLIEHNADARAITNFGHNIFHIACIYNHLEMCRFISELGKFNDLLSAECTEKWNATLYAAKNGHTDVLNFLLEKNVSFTHSSASGRNALHIACDNGHFDSCKVIIDNCPSLLNEVDFTGRHAGHFAVRGGNLDILTYLETMMDVTKNTYNGMNILHMACLHCHIKMCAYIIKKYPYLNVQKTETGWTTAHFAAEKGNNKGNEIEIFKILLNGVEDVDFKTLTKNGNSVLTLAIKCNDYDFVEYLLRFQTELLNIPNVNNPREMCSDDFKMKLILDKYLS